MLRKYFCNTIKDLRFVGECVRYFPTDAKRKHREVSEKLAVVKQNGNSVAITAARNELIKTDLFIVGLPVLWMFSILLFWFGF